MPVLTPGHRRALVRGRGRFLADLELEGAAEVAFVRSPHAHARILGVERPAQSVTAQDLALRPVVIEGPGLRGTPWYPLAAGRARYPGEPVAAVWAADRYLAEDLAEEVLVEYGGLPAEEPLHLELPDGVVFEQEYSAGDLKAAFGAADLVLERTFRAPRVAPLPLECRGAAAEFDGATGAVTLWTSTQVPDLVRTGVARCLGLDERQVRVIVPDVGGGFGLKAHLFAEEVVVAALARRLGRPVRWLEDRLENLTAGTHAHDNAIALRAALSREGRLLAFDATVTADVGAYSVFPFSASLEPTTAGGSLFGPYAFGAYRCRAKAVVSARCPVGAYRGVGITSGVFAGERLLDDAAAELGLDPLEIRRRNALTGLPLTTTAGRRLDSGDYQALLARLEAAAGYSELREEQGRARAEGRLIGIGIGFFNEHAGTGSRGYLARGISTIPGTDAARVRVTETGRVEIYTSAAEAGQGHPETYRALAARELGVSPDSVDVIEGDTSSCPEGTGTFTSRGAVSVLESVVQALRRAAAQDLAPGTDVTHVNDPHPLFSSGAHLAVVEVDQESWLPRVTRYVAVEDCGTVVEAAVVDGQVRGGVAMGIGDVLLSEQVYSPDGQNLTSTLLDYLVPLATDVPPVEVSHLDLPTPATTLGSKGVGEAGTIGAFAAVPNAVADALRPLGARIDTLPCTPERIRAAVRSTSGV